MDRLCVVSMALPRNLHIFFITTHYHVNSDTCTSIGIISGPVQTLIQTFSGLRLWASKIFSPVLGPYTMFTLTSCSNILICLDIQPVDVHVSDAAFCASNLGLHCLSLIVFYGLSVRILTITIILPGQGVSPHSLNSSHGPVQLAPPYSGPIHTRDLLCIDPPHVTGHSSQSDHWSHTPST